MIELFIIICMAILSRLSGSGFGDRWGVSWLPEVVFAHAIGTTFGYALVPYLGPDYATLVACIAWGWSYGFMQSGTWMFLRWESHKDPNISRKGTLKPIIDWIAARFGYRLGDEGYAWTAAAVKGFLIGLPVGGFPLAILWPLGYEIGSHAKGRVERFGIEPHAVSELMAGAGAGLSIVLFLNFLP